MLVWFNELSATRSGGFGVGAITYAEIDAWMRLTGRAPSAFEIRALRRVDAAFLAVING